MNFDPSFESFNPSFDNGILLIWADLETTGLDYDSDVILEMAFRATDYAGTPASGLRTGLASLYEPRVRSRYADTRWFGNADTVREMHTENGLWDEVYQAHRNTGGSEVRGLTQFAFGRAINDFAERLVRQYPEITDIRLAGSTIGFDRRFIETAHGEELFAEITRTTRGRVKGHRVHDLSTLRPIVKELGHDPDSVNIDSGDTHRAAADVERDIRQWIAIRDWLGL